jgi:hypothetical protein
MIYGANEEIDVYVDGSIECKVYANGNSLDLEDSYEYEYLLGRGGSRIGVS